MDHLLKVSQQTFWQVVGKIITSLSTFVILGIVARNYGKEGTGVFTLALTYLAIFYLLADFGFNAHALKQFQINEWRKLLGVRLLWSGVLVVLAIITLPLWPFSNPVFMQAVLFGSLAIFGSAIFITANLIFQDKSRYDLSVFASSVGTLFSLPLFVLFSLYRFPVSFLLLAHLSSWLLIAIGALILVRKYVSKLTPVFDLQYTKILFKDSWLIAATLALNVVYFRADSFMIAYFKGTSEVGIYNVAYSVFQSALVLPTFIMNAYYPLMLKSLSKIKSVALGLLALSFSGLVITLFLAPFVINILAGKEFTGSIISLQILCLGFPAFFLSSLLMWVFISKGWYKTMFLLYTSGMIFNLVLNFIFIPKFSYIAASVVTVISEYLILILQVMILWRNKNRL